MKPESSVEPVTLKYWYANAEINATKTVATWKSPTTT